jgi:GIY-YIG catalytic domain.
MSDLPTNTGGIYLFVAKPNLIPNSHFYLLYVGRAHYTYNQNLRKRCKEYIKEQSRPKVKRMIEGWGQYLYVRYLPLTDNDLIDSIESEIINKVLPPFNDMIPDKQIRTAVKAFSV